MPDGKEYTEHPSHLVVSAEGPENEKVPKDNTANDDQKIGGKGKFDGEHSDEGGPTAAEAKGSEVAKGLAAIEKALAELRKMAAPEAGAAGEDAPTEVGASFAGAGDSLGKAQERFLKNLDGYLTKFEKHIMNEVKSVLEKNNDSLKKSMGLVATGASTPQPNTPTQTSAQGTPATPLKKNEDGKRRVPTFDELASGPKLRGML